jgi:hypothetical protein
VVAAGLLELERGAALGSRRAAIRARNILITAVLCACHPAPPPGSPYDFSKGEDVIQAMHDRYYARWPDNMTMAQSNIATPGKDTTMSVWLTAVVPPDRMRIDYVPRDLANGRLIVRDTEYLITNALPTQIRRDIDPQFLLQHRVYFLPVSATVSRLRELGVNLNKVSQATWDGRAMWVLGDPPNAQGSRQIWIDRELMIIVRILEPSARDGTLVSEKRFLQYERMNSMYVPRTIDTYEEGVRVLRQENKQIRVNQRLDTLLFLPYTWTQGRHWYQQALIR